MSSGYQIVEVDRARLTGCPSSARNEDALFPRAPAGAAVLDRLDESFAFLSSSFEILAWTSTSVALASSESVEIEHLSFPLSESARFFPLRGVCLSPGTFDL